MGSKRFAGHPVVRRGYAILTLITERVGKTLDYLEFQLASDFVQSVSKALRQLTDTEINELYLTTHTGPNLGDYVGAWMAVLLPLIEAEAQLRRDIEVLPDLGLLLAPELYRKGGAHDLPF